MSSQKASTMPRSGRPPRRPDGNKPSSLTIRLAANIKNLLIDQAEATDLTVTEYISALVLRDAGAKETSEG
jgi:hypothetical protein